MIDDRVLDRSLALLEELYNRTRAGKIGWLDAGFDLSSDVPLPYGQEPKHLGFKTQSGDFTLRIQRIPDANFPNEPDFALHIIEPESGVIIETISNITLGAALDRKLAGGLTPYVVLREIYDMARRQAQHVDDVLDRVLASLRQEQGARPD